jgi:predicted RNase H-like nuclease (RuvC/YqgF family)
LEKYVVDNLTRHAKISELAKEDYKAVDNLYYEIDKPQELLENIKDGKLIEVTIKVIEKGEIDAITHLEANKKGQEKPWSKEALREENRNNLKLLKKEAENNENLTKENEGLQKELEETKKLLKKAQEIIEIQETEKEELHTQNLDLNDKLKEKDSKISNLEKLYRKVKTLPKKPHKVKLLGKNLKTKFQQTTKKDNIQEQKPEMTARIEVNQSINH